MTDNNLNNDALERLKQRSRPTVESRSDSLKSTFPDTSMSGMLDKQVSKNVDNSSNGSVEASPKASVAAEQELETEQSTLRLEAAVSERLQALCRTEGICREVLIEAMFEYCEGNAEALSAVLTEAKAKNEYRRQIANRRRAKSMMDKFG